MNAIVKLWKKESAMITAVILALAGVVTLPGGWDKVLGVLLPLLGGGVVRQTVFTGTTLQKAVQAAATAVATQLTPQTVGPAGQVPISAQAVVASVVASSVSPGPTAPSPATPASPV